MVETLDKDRLKNFRNLLVTLDGQDPDMQQSLNNFMDFKSDIERTNLPTRDDVHFMTYLDFVGRSLFGNMKNPFTDLAKSAATAFMAKGGLKSEQFVRLMQKGFDLSQLQMAQEQQQQSNFFDRFRRRNEE